MTAAEYQKHLADIAAAQEAEFFRLLVALKMEGVSSDTAARTAFDIRCNPLFNPAAKRDDSARAGQ